MRTNFDFSPYRRSTVGFDRLFDFLENARAEQADNYPPYDIEKVSDDRYRITLAIAGFKPGDIDITARQNLLVISGRKSENRNKDGNYVHMGIATRAFERRFELADFVRADGADLQDGLLTIDLVREIPDAMKPRKIEIGSGATQTLEGRDERAGQASATDQHEQAEAEAAA
ncbi:Hsp20 family protein [Sphingomonas sp.]|uniref:Hsp20 family protein n=1 Tax=Sphingomonas sp. TaxID=28214 RepID=UPI002FC80B8C